MRNLSTIGRIFFGIAIAALGFLTIYHRDFPYMLIPAKHYWITSLTTIAYTFGTMLMLAGTCIVFNKKTRAASLLLGTMLLLIFCFYFIPYQLFVSPDYLAFGDWENAAKELTLTCGAFVIAGWFSEENENPFSRFVSKLIRFGTILFSITIISYGINHFLYAEQAVDYVPSWIPYPLFWLYFTGTALLGSGIAIILKIKIELIASLLGAMIFIWFIILHIPRMAVSPVVDLGTEADSACLALAYSGIAFVIAGNTKKAKIKKS